MGKSGAYFLADRGLFHMAELLQQLDQMHDVLWTSNVVDHLLETLSKGNEDLVVVVNEI